jgi:chromosome partitioning protein
MSAAFEEERKVIARGQLEDFSALSVLQALSLSRQYTSVELFDENDKAVGRVTLKSGMVLEASLAGSGVRGTVALRELLTRSLHSFQVERLPIPERFPEPIGRLATELETVEAVRRSSVPPRPERAVAPPPVVAAPRNGASVSGPVPAPATAGGCPTVAIASPKGGCGKTTLALNLAVSLARSGLRVILIDADPNGDVLSAIGGRARAVKGTFDALSDDVDPRDLFMDTAIPGLRIIPAMGETVAASLTGGVPDVGLWRRFLEKPRSDADLVLVDLPAGMFGVSQEALRAVTHVLGVLQAEVIPQRSFEMFQRGLSSVNSSAKVLGVVLNMFQRSHPASVSVLVEAGQDFPSEWLFGTPIPRSEVFLDASEQGMPVSLADGNAASIVSLLFDALATELRERLELSQPKTRTKPKSFLL